MQMDLYRNNANLYKAFGLLLACAIAGAGASASSYFPVREPGNPDGLTASIAEMGSKALKRMREPRLWLSQTAPMNTVYRLTVLPTWGNAITIRVESSGDSFKLFARRLSGDAGYRPGRMAERVDKVLTQKDSLDLRTLLQSLKAFEMPAEEDYVNGFDGEEWVLECIEGGRYHVLQRWSIVDNETKQRGLADLLALAAFLVDKSGLKVRPSNLDQELLPSHTKIGPHQ